MLISTHPGSLKGSLFSEEVGHVTLVGLGVLLPLHLGEHKKIPLHVLVNLQHRGLVATPVAVVGRGPHRDKRLVGEPELEALHHQLMSASNQVKTVNVVELSCDSSAEEVASATG